MMNQTRKSGRSGGLRAAGVALLGAVALLAGCASTLSSQVTAFHLPDTRFEGRRFAVVASAEQAGSLEYRSYAEQVRRALSAHGLVDVGPAASTEPAAPTASPPGAELAVRLHYRIDDGRPVAVSSPTYGYLHAGPVWSMTPYIGPGGRVHYTWVPSWPMTYGVVGHEVSQSVIYRRELRVEIDDARQPPAEGGKPPPGRLYEGVAISEGGSATLAPVMPAMIRALFAEFPGPSGRSRIVRVPFDDPAPKR